MWIFRELNVLPDFRYPDNIRLGIAPLYNSFLDIHTAVLRLQEAVEKKLYARYASEKPVVT